MSHPDNQKEVFVIIPAYNEEKVIKDVLGELLPFQYSLVVVDDGSQVSLQEMLKPFPVYVVRHRINLGQGAALQTGIDFALLKKAAYMVTFDSDGQHQAADIQKLLAPLRSGEADITLGSRFISRPTDIPAGRRILLQLARFVNYLFTGLLLTDAHNGLRAMTAKAAALIHIRQNGMAHATEIVSEIKKHRLRFKEIPVTVRYTDYSKKKGQTVWGSFRIFIDLLLIKIFK